MKLRNGKSYDYFCWEKVIYRSQLKASCAQIVPIRVGNEIIEDGICGNSYLEIRGGIEKRIVRQGLEKGFLMKEWNGRIVSNVFLNTQSFIKNKIFMKSLQRELLKNGVIVNTVSYID